ncbi:hypothetical protein [Halobaculum rarum]
MSKARLGNRGHSSFDRAADAQHVRLDRVSDSVGRLTDESDR